MRRLLGVGAIVLGGVGALVCAAAVGTGWWVEAAVVDRATRAAAGLDRGLAEADARLERVETRLAAVRGEIADARAEAERLATDNPERPRVRDATERLLDRLLPTIERAAALADALRTVAAGLRAAEEVVTQVGFAVEQPSRARAAADAIDRGAEVLTVPPARVAALKATATARLARELAELAREAAAGSERLAAGLADARREVADARGRATAVRDRTVFCARAAAVANVLIWLWIGLGQVALIGWGRRRLGRRSPADPRIPDRPSLNR